MNTLYKKDGKIKQRKHIVLYYEDRQVFNPSEEELIENGWEKYEIPQPTEEELFQREKQNKLTEIQLYDISNDVNGFYINGNNLWLDRSEREALTRRFNIELDKGKTDATLWKNGIKFTLDIKTAIQMLDDLEYYAIQCYDNTQEHLVNVSNITTMEELETYDYRTGYPEKLRF